jgi:hypothetical protein
MRLGENITGQPGRRAWELKVKYTFAAEGRLPEELLDGAINGQLVGTEQGPERSPCEQAVATGGIEVVGEGDTMAIDDLKDLVLAVAVEGGPLDGGCILDVSSKRAPVEDHLVLVMSDSELAPLVHRRERHYKRANLVDSSGGVNVGFELPRGAGVDLGGDVNISIRAVYMN